MAKLAFVGLGLMGTPMATRLLEAGHDLTVWNRTTNKTRPLADRGASVASTPAQAATGAEAAITMVTNPEALEQVVLGEGGLAAALAPGQLLIDMSTVGPQAVGSVAARLPGGVRMVDAPVRSSVAEATTGRLAIYVGADPGDFQRVQPILAPLGTLHHVGAPGAGAATKVVVNSTLGAAIAAFGDEFVIAAVGPLTSGILAGLFGVVNVLGRDTLPEPLVGTLGYLAWTNLLLAGFNLVPGFPLDGGRLLRSAIWQATGSLSRATRIASLAGQAVGWLLVAAGVASLLAGNLAGGIWFAFIGWFLVQAARSSYEELQLRDMLRGVEAEDVMAGDLLRIPPDLSLQDAVDDYFMRYDHGAFPVDEQGRTIGLLTLRGVRRVPREQWPTRRVRELMVPLGDQVVVAPDARMDQVMGKLQDGEAGRVLVVQDGEVVGIITPSDLTRWLRRWRALEGRMR